MSQVRLYVDEDAMQGILVQGLLSRGIDVVSATSAAMVNRDDEDHLMTATGLRRALYSYNGRDYQRLHTEWLRGGRTHAGIILAAQQRYQIGDEVGRLSRLVARLSAGEMRDRLEFLNSWG